MDDAEGAEWHGRSFVMKLDDGGVHRGKFKFN
jgi:hypothetical protein